MILRAPVLPRVSIRYCLLIFMSSLFAITYNEWIRICLFWWTIPLLPIIRYGLLGEWERAKEDIAISIKYLAISTEYNVRRFSVSPGTRSGASYMEYASQASLWRRQEEPPKDQITKAQKKKLMMSAKYPLFITFLQSVSTNWKPRRSATFGQTPQRRILCHHG